jgi:hypothetical protein
MDYYIQPTTTMTFFEAVKKLTKDLAGKNDTLLHATRRCSTLLDATLSYANPRCSTLFESGQRWSTLINA